MDIMELGSKLLNDNMGLNVDPETMQSAISGLLGDGQGGVDLAGLVGKMTQNGDLGALVNSWLGDGANSAISAESVQGLLGEDALANFASAIGADTGSATQGLTDALPQMMDQASSGGSLLDAAGGLGGLMNAAKSFLS